MIRKIAAAAVITLLLAYFITLILHVSAHEEQYLWDFRTHREAGRLLASGANPYDADILSPHARTTFLYTYPPVTLFFYRLFAIPDYTTAFHIFLVGKLVLLIGLVFLWQKVFLRESGAILFYVFCLLAFNSAVFLDMIAGNINLVQQAMLWIGFSFYIRGRYALFCTFILIGASFKMTPIFFLILMLLPDDNRKYTYFFGAGAVFLAYLLSQYLIVPDLFTGFIENALIVVGEKGQVVPSTNKLIASVLEMMAKMTGFEPPRTLASVLFLALAAGIGFVSVKAWMQLRRSNRKDRAMLEVFLVCLLYALIHPRFKDYGYILLLVPSYYIIVNAPYMKLAPFLFVLFIMSNRLMLPIAGSIYDIVWAYYPLMVAYCVWGLYLNHIFSRGAIKYK